MRMGKRGEGFQHQFRREIRTRADVFKDLVYVVKASE